MVSVSVVKVGMESIVLLRVVLVCVIVMEDVFWIKMVGIVCVSLDGEEWVVM